MVYSGKNYSAAPAGTAKVGIEDMEEIGEIGEIGDTEENMVNVEVDVEETGSQDGNSSTVETTT